MAWRLVTICKRKTENASNTIAMGARPGFHIFFGVIKRKPRPDHIASSEDKQSNVASANFAGRPSTVVSVDFAARPSGVASADFAGRPSVVISAYFAAGIFFLQIMMQLFLIYNQSLLMVIG
ncbi:hypothetical protein ACQJBY_018392 [Aegilops geniculata]